MLKLKNNIFKESFKVLNLLLVCFLVFSLNSCKKDKDIEEISYPLETAEMVSHVTSGVISSDEKIRVRFVSPIINENLVGQSLKKKVFSFESSIDEITKW